MLVWDATEAGRQFRVTVEPSGSRWLPWPARWSRWWWEIEEFVADGSGWLTHAYGGGSGGGFTLRRAMVLASRAVDEIAYRDEGEVRDGLRSIRD